MSFIPKSVDNRVLITLVAQKFGVGVRDVFSDFRERKVTRARWAAMYVLRHEKGYSFPEIGRVMNRDHTTVIHGVRRVEADPELLAIATGLITEPLDAFADWNFYL